MYFLYAGSSTVLYIQLSNQSDSERVQINAKFREDTIHPETKERERDKLEKGEEVRDYLGG